MSCLFVLLLEKCFVLLRSKVSFIFFNQVHTLRGANTLPFPVKCLVTWPFFSVSVSRRCLKITLKTFQNNLTKDLKTKLANPWHIWVQTLLSAGPGFGTQPRVDCWVKIVTAKWWTFGEWGGPLVRGPKLALGQPYSW